MTTPQYRITIQHEKFGFLLSETFLNGKQFNLFLKMIQGCLELKNDLTFFNGTDFLIHIPINYLKESIILTSTDNLTLAEYYIQKSKIEAEHTI